MTKLLLAVDIADTVRSADQDATGLDIDAAAERLVRDHPEANVSIAEVAETLTEEAGVGFD